MGRDGNTALSCEWLSSLSGQFGIVMVGEVMTPPVPSWPSCAGALLLPPAGSGLVL